MGADTSLKLLKLWIQFAEKKPEGSLEQFSDWLSQELNHSEKSIKFDGISVKQEFGYYFGRITGYAEYWSKMAFKDTGLRKIEEFGVLKIIFIFKNPTKKEIISKTLNVNTTILEIIKRLVKNGYVEEVRDKDDGRIIRCTISPLGIEVMTAAEEKMSYVTDFLTGDLTLEEIEFAARIFKKLDRFHLHYYKNDQYTEVEKLPKQD